MTKTVFNFDNDTIKSAVSDNLERITDAIDFITYDIMAACEAEFNSDENSNNPSPHYVDNALHQQAYYQACMEVSLLILKTLPKVIRDHNAPFCLPVDATRTEYLFPCAELKDSDND